MNIEKPLSAIVATALSLVVLHPGLARAADRDPAAAEALYHSGRKLVSEGKWAEGCAKFDASMELNPAASTLINIAKCREHDGRLSEALVDYKRALQLNQDTLGGARKKALEKVAKEGAASVEARLARVELVVKTRPEGLEVAWDGRSLPLAALGEPIPLDPGKHTFEATAPDHEKAERTLELAEGQKATVELSLVPVKKQDSGAKVEPAKPDPAKPDPAKPGPDKPPADGGARSGGVPAWAYVAGGLGLAAVGGGVYFRLDQMAAEDRIRENCPGEPPICDPSKGYDPTDDNARKNQSFYLFVGLTAAGAVGIGAAVIGIARGVGQKKAKATSVHVAPWIGRGEGGFVMQGAF